MRAIVREQQQDHPGYEEVCRRFLADQKDFSEDNLKKAGITRRYQNDDKVRCKEEIVEVIRDGSFKDVVGHKDILKYISSAVENNRVSHAYILNGREVPVRRCWRICSP